MNFAAMNSASINPKMSTQRKRYERLAANCISIGEKKTEDEDCEYARALCGAATGRARCTESDRGCLSFARAAKLIDTCAHVAFLFSCF